MGDETDFPLMRAAHEQETREDEPLIRQLRTACQEAEGTFNLATGTCHTEHGEMRVDATGEGVILREQKIIDSARTPTLFARVPDVQRIEYSDPMITADRGPGEGIISLHNDKDKEGRY